MYAHQHQYGYENNNHYDFGISGALLSQKHLSFPTIAYEQGFDLKLLESKITRARASLSFASLALLSDFLTRALTIGDKIS